VVLSGEDDVAHASLLGQACLPLSVELDRVEALASLSHSPSGIFALRIIRSLTPGTHLPLQTLARIE